jgi:hypothetical protein
LHSSVGPSSSVLLGDCPGSVARCVNVRGRGKVPA